MASFTPGGSKDYVKLDKLDHKCSEFCLSSSCGHSLDKSISYEQIHPTFPNRLLSLVSSDRVRTSVYVAQRLLAMKLASKRRTNMEDPMEPRGCIELNSMRYIYITHMHNQNMFLKYTNNIKPTKTYVASLYKSYVTGKKNDP